MKKHILNQTQRTYLLSALIALLVSLAVIGLDNWQRPADITIERAPDSLQKPVLYTADKEGNITPLDFTETTKKVLDAVVHITSRGTQPYGQNYRQLPDPFKEFFRDSPFGRYFDSPGGETPQERAPEAGTPEELPRIGTGSGVIINKDGYIVTNNHVIAQADEVEVTLHNNETYEAKVIGVDPTTDLALLKIDAADLKTLALVNSDDVEVGEWVLAIGNPFSLNSTVTAGIVSAKARNININREELAVESFIQTDAAINPGNSGGALVNLNGDLIGINTAIASRTGSYSGYGFAVPSNIVSKVVEDLLEYGNVQRGILGVRIQNLDGRLAEEKGIDLVPGVYVASVNEGSAAEQAGIQAGDVITAVNKKPVASSPRLQELIAGFRPGDEVDIMLLRDGKSRKIGVTLKDSAGVAAVVARTDRELFNRLGAELSTLNPEKAADLELDGGVEVTRLYPGLLRQETRMREGFIVTRVNGKEVRSLEDFREELEKSRDGGVMLAGRYPDSPKMYYYAFGLDS
ncbi:Do family serine endopeptidase [Robiginitalea sp. SC105]|uniref:Do family serine endopeptidase n=1 Tax=Robiginitalea sp. SC105 TaxID=2762332 RepID=UPI00163A3245|nr:Do family serine endopeptidase [Robiginitalea sp. SC105]MBC2838252.1 Do family serine endopeptidase [Robiginitalea sp. SC105]